MKCYTYIEVVRFTDQRVVKRVDVTGRSSRSADKVERGMNTNMNHAEYFTRVKTFNEPQETEINHA